MKTAIVLICSILSGCQYIGHQKPRDTGIFTYGQGDMKPSPAQPKRLFCYRSLGSIECFTEPVPERESQLVNYYDSCDDCLLF